MHCTISSLFLLFHDCRVHVIHRTVTFSSQDSESDSGPTRDRQSTTSKGSAGATFSLRRDDAADEEAGSNSRRILLTLKIAIGLVFFVVVLVSSVLSKLTLVSLTDALRSLTWMYHNNTPTDEKEWKKNNLDKTVSLYWQLLLVLLAPNCLTFLRCLFFGVLGKTRKSYPWPTASAAFLVMLNVYLLLWWLLWCCWIYCSC